MPHPVLYALLVQVGLTFVLLWMLAVARLGAAKRGEVRLEEVALSTDRWPPRARRIANAFSNQFELPVLFYLWVLLVVDAKWDGTLELIAAFVFVVSRIVHAWIYVTSNRVVHRFYAYAVGATLLTIMWAVYAVRLIFTGTI